MKIFVAVLLMSVLAVSTAGPILNLTKGDSNSDLTDFENLDGTSSISCYNTDAEQKTSLVKCPGFATKCATASFDITIFSTPQHVQAYFCSNDEQCNNEGTEFCKTMKKESPYPVEHCKVNCCATDGCNKPE
ncbi:uncharacterized protein LOC143446137 [Clavelina lepadiformis]|uniref:uncharacterized protein LOC143446137 n=1 Tax=Clavelina lepadiformis TaxID=159417 RepID=UPI0040424871